MAAEHTVGSLSFFIRKGVSKCQEISEVFYLFQVGLWAKYFNNVFLFNFFSRVGLFKNNISLLFISILLKDNLASDLDDKQNRLSQQVPHFLVDSFGQNCTHGWILEVQRHLIFLLVKLFSLLVYSHLQAGHFCLHISCESIHFRCQLLLLSLLILGKLCLSQLQFFFGHLN